MKLIIQIPCYNEEKYLPTTLSELPKNILGFDHVEILVIDDGSIDNTAKVAQAHGVNHVVKHNINKGLAEAFKTGIEKSLALGADIIVNTDADNQYPGKYIPSLIAPIVDGEAEIVIGDRQISQIDHFSFVKKILQKLGSWVVRKVSGTNIPDAPSGFRAYSRDAAMRINVLTDFSYTLDTIIQAGKKNIVMKSIPIKTNQVERPSRLFNNNWSYVFRSSKTIINLFFFYEPLKYFSIISMPLFLFGSLLWVRYLFIWHSIGYLSLRGAHLQSIIVGGIFLLIAFFIICLGLIGKLLAQNRNLIENQLYIQKTMKETDIDD